MDNKNEKKKESIDDILSDLNGLLNKMPSILDGIKMPEIKPVEFSRSEQAPAPLPAPAENTRTEPVKEAVPPAAQAPFDGDRTVVLADFSGLPEGASAPGGEPPSEPSFTSSNEEANPFTDLSSLLEDKSSSKENLNSFDGDKTVVINSLSSLPEGASAPEEEAEKLLPQRLGDFMFRENAENPEAELMPPAGSAKLEGSPLEPPAARIKIEGREDAPLSISELKPLPKPAGKPEDGLQEASLVNPDQEADLSFSRPEDNAAGESGKPEDLSSLPVAGLSGASDAFADFSIPDIDALLQMSEAKPAAGPDAGIPEQAAAPAPLTPSNSPEPSMDDLAEYEKQMTAAAPQEADMGFGGPADGSQEPSPFQEPAQPEPAAAGQPDFGAFTIEPSSSETSAEVPAPGETSPPEFMPEAVANGLELPANAAEGTPTPAPLQEQEAAPQPEFGSFELPASVQENQDAAPAADGAVQPEPAAGVPAVEGELSPSPAAQDTAKFAPGEAPVLQPPSQEPAASAEPFLTVGVQDGPLSAPAADQASPDGDKTMVMNATVPGGEEDKTVVFQASTGPGITSRAKISDLGDLSKKGVPEGIPEERVRSLFFLYSSEGGGLCANVLAEIDAVCQRSQANPMFVKRAGVKVFDPDLNANYVLQMVTDAGAAGLVCVDGIPQEKIYEIENVFATSGLYFKHFDPDSFSHTAVLDMLLEVILR